MSDHDLLIRIATMVEMMQSRLEEHINKDRRRELLYLGVTLTACVSAIGVFINGMIN